MNTDLMLLLKKNIIPKDVRLEVPGLNENAILYVYPPMYALTKTGAIKWYEVEIHNKKTHYDIIRRKASKIGGKAQVDITTISSGVNQGKKNETSMQEQAVLAANSLVSRLRDKGYKSAEEIGINPLSENLSKLIIEKMGAEHNTDAKGQIKPMLAGKDMSKIEYPCSAQPKYNGVRCLAIRKGGRVALLSRNGKYYFIERVEEVLLEKMQPGDVWDGELYCEGITFQEIIQAVKTMNKKHPNQDKIQYIVYDVPYPGQIWKDRLGKLNSLDLPVFTKTQKSPVCKSQTVEVRNLEDANLCHTGFIDQQFEGTMIRNYKGKYEYGFRSKDLIKMKDFQDAEFTIIDVISATGRNAGTAVFVLTGFHQEGDERVEIQFNAVSEGTTEHRAKQLKDRKKLIGKMATVKFQNYSDDGVPIFPNVIAIRDYE